MYATRQDMEARFGAEEMDRLDAPAGRVEAVLADVASEVEAAVGSVYDLPRESALLLSLECDLARARLYDDVSPETVTTRANDARRKLTDLREGRLQLTDASGAPIPRRNRVQTSGGSPVFRREDLRGS